MVTQNAAIKTVESFVEDLKRTGLHLRKAILFGSYAKNQQREFSDIDVALVADEFVGVGFEDIQLFVDLLLNYIQIQPKTYQTKYFNEGDPFVDEIKRTGIEIRIN